MSKPVSLVEAASVESPSEGFCDATTSTTVEYVDLSSYIGGYVTITCETTSHYITFGPNNTFTMDVDAAAVGTDYVAFPLSTSDKFSCVISSAKPFLGYRTISGTGILRVHRS